MGKFDGKLLVSDMDATLFDSHHRISDKNREAIEYFKAEGGSFGVASGRMQAAVENYLDVLGINAPAILHNGAKVYSFGDDTLLYQKDIEPERKEAIRRVWETQPHLGIEIYANEKVYIMQECFETDRFKTKNYDVTFHMPEKVWNEPWTKALIVGEAHDLDVFEPIYRREYDTGYIVRSGKHYLDIVANGVSKGYGVMRVAEYLGIDRENIYTVGDNMNDFEMIEYAAHGYAVANAVDALKAAAECVVPSNDEDAIAYIIYNLI